MWKSFIHSFNCILIEIKIKINFASSSSVGLNRGLNVIQYYYYSRVSQRRKHHLVSIACEALLMTMMKSGCKQIHAKKLTHTLRHTHTHTDLHTHTYIHTHTHTYTHIYTHIHTHTHTYTYIHSYMLKFIYSVKNTTYMNRRPCTCLPFGTIKAVCGW